MANALADPILLFFVAGLFASGFLLANGRGKKGLEGTNRMLDGSLAFATTGPVSYTHLTLPTIYSV